ncbi:hypothetical protein ASPTUDRAFT_701685 [Aspergillus tubingensis CBS 134.48]|uniref:Uncharacterized protein n=1 Tax=Aspergillus tubingensis (strain CBS 134.48) TaxID=767770 RepID=A0A1L9N1B3_ASPTC|nr:hypothetical protein ASPTUDRAFT_701685 [Aspergillus tubingensis CBS 134.48]
MCWGRVFLSKTGIWATLRAAYLFDLFSLLFFVLAMNNGLYVPPARFVSTLGLLFLSLLLFFLFFFYYGISPHLILFLSACCFTCVEFVCQNEHYSTILYHFSL